jgi:hypothetical protein
VSRPQPPLPGTMTKRILSPHAGSPLICFSRGRASLRLPLVPALATATVRPSPTGSPASTESLRLSGRRASAAASRGQRSQPRPAAAAASGCPCCLHQQLPPHSTCQSVVSKKESKEKKGRMLIRLLAMGREEGVQRHVGAHRGRPRLRYGGIGLRWLTGGSGALSARRARLGLAVLL